MPKRKAEKKTPAPVPSAGCDSPALVDDWHSDPQKLNEWLGREAGEPVYVATDTVDLTSELKKGLSFVRKAQREGGAG